MLKLTETYEVVGKDGKKKNISDLLKQDFKHK